MQWSVRNPTRGSMRPWLQASGSLSARLAACGKDFAVQVLKQGRQPLTQDEAGALGVPCQRMGYVREVVLRVDDVAMVFARSVTAHADSLGAWRSVRGLGSRPLADVLFKRAGIARRPLAFAKLPKASRLQRHAVRQWRAATGEDRSDTALLARRSVFVHQSAALLVMEVFAAKARCWAKAGAASDMASTKWRPR